MNRRYSNSHGRSRARAGTWYGEGPHGEWFEPGRLVRRERFVIGKGWVLAWYLVCLLARVLWAVTAWAVRHWRLTAPLAVVGYAWYRLGTQMTEVTALAAVTALTIAGCVWWWLDAATFYNQVTARAYGRVRWTVAYRRRWREVMHGCGLMTFRDGAEYVPVPRSIRSRRNVDVLHVRLAAGQTPHLLTGATEALRHALGAFRVDARESKPGWVRLTIHRHDPLANPVPVTHRAYAHAVRRGAVKVRALDLPGDGEHVALLRLAVVDLLAAVPVGITETGRVLALAVRGVHVLIAGCTGSGKSGLVWALLRGLAPAIHAGHVTVTGLDPKWMELAPGRGLIDVITDVDTMPQVLDDLVAEMDTRCRALEGLNRTHVPSRGAPHRIVLVDELATLTALQDRRSKERVEAALGHLGSRGRAAGFTVILTTVEPTKEVVRWRALHAVKVGFRMEEASHTDMTLGDGARDRGAYCDQITLSTPGVGFVKEDGDPHPVRFRVVHLTDTDIAAFVTAPAPAPADADAVVRVVDVTDLPEPVDSVDLVTEPGSDGDDTTGGAR